MDNLTDDDCRFFQQMANSGHAGTHRPKKSRQGIYVCTADGKFLASINHLDAGRVLETLKRGLKKWNQLPAKERIPTSPLKITAKHRWENLRPMDGLVLTVHSRDLHHAANPDSKPLKTWNVDSAWFNSNEMKSLIPDDIKPGQSFDFPELFVSRLCKLHLVDSVKGQTAPFRANEVVGSKMTATVRVANDEKVELLISGQTSGVCESGQFARGVMTKLVGIATFEQKLQRFTKFDMVAIGKRWGKTRFNDRVAQQRESPIGFVFQLTSPDDDVVIPGIVWAYDAPWLRLSPQE